MPTFCPSTASNPIFMVHKAGNSIGLRLSLGTIAKLLELGTMGKKQLVRRE
jgi:hypothetical protein